MKFSGRKDGPKGRMRPLRARDSAELRKVASGSAAQGLWLGNRKVGSQVIRKDRSRLFFGRGTVGEVRRKGRRASDRVKEATHSFRVRFS